MDDKEYLADERLYHCLNLARELALSTGLVDDFNRYFSLKRLINNITNPNLEIYEQESSNKKFNEDNGFTNLL